MSSSSQAAKEPREGDVIGGRYYLSKLLQRGGMGAVWLARHTSLNLPRAIKFIRSSDEATMIKLRARFEIEAQAVARLHGHPNIVQIFDHGIDGDIPYIVMELLSGETLQARLRRERRLSVDATKQVLKEIVSGLTRAHSLKIVHRDLKPGNIFFAQNNDTETVKILDFGIVKMLGERQAIYTTGALGTIAYMSPEQIRNDRVAIDERTDLWALAVILFECLTGELPHSADNDVGIIGSILLGEGPAWNASTRVRGVAPAFDAFFRRAFQHEKADRFQTAAEMLSAFESAAGTVAAWVPAASRALLTEVLPDTKGIPDERPRIDPGFDEATAKPKRGVKRRSSDEMETIIHPKRGSPGSGAARANSAKTTTVNRHLSGFTARLPRLKLIFFGMSAAIIIFAGLTVFLAVDGLSGSEDRSPTEPELTASNQPPAPAPPASPTPSASAIAVDVSAHSERPPETPAAPAAPTGSAALQPSAPSTQPPPAVAKPTASPIRPPSPAAKPTASPPPAAKVPTPSPSPHKPPPSKERPRWMD